MNENNFNGYPFLKAARGNWHNALYIKCTHITCPYGQSSICEGFLFVADADGTPLLATAEDIRRLTHETVEPEGCRGILWQHSFQSVYASYIDWHMEDDTQCPLLELCQKQRIPPCR